MSAPILRLVGGTAVSNPGEAPPARRPNAFPPKLGAARPALPLAAVPFAPPTRTLDPNAREHYLDASRHLVFQPANFPSGELHAEAWEKILALPLLNGHCVRDLLRFLARQEGECASHSAASAETLTLLRQLLDRRGIVPEPGGRPAGFTVADGRLLKWAPELRPYRRVYAEQEAPVRLDMPEDREPVALDLTDLPEAARQAVPARASPLRPPFDFDKMSVAELKELRAWLRREIGNTILENGRTVRQNLLDVRRHWNRRSSEGIVRKRDELLMHIGLLALPPVPYGRPTDGIGRLYGAQRLTFFLPRFRDYYRVLHHTNFRFY